eukprot:5187930-Ditylum_brightwellii.AAC.1
MAARNETVDISHIELAKRMDVLQKEIEHIDKIHVALFEKAVEMSTKQNQVNAIARQYKEVSCFLNDVLKLQVDAKRARLHFKAKQDCHEQVAWEIFVDACNRVLMPYREYQA